jgi:hypothetical protein
MDKIRSVIDFDVHAIKKQRIAAGLDQEAEDLYLKLKSTAANTITKPSMKQGSRTLLEAAPGGLDATCGKAGPAGGRGAPSASPAGAPCFSHEGGAARGRWGS